MLILLGHNLSKDSTRRQAAEKRQATIVHALEVAEARKQKRRRLNRSQGGDLNPDALEVLYINFVAAHHESLSLVECHQFRALLNFLNPETEAWLPASHRTIKEWLLRQFNLQKVPVRLVLEKAESLIHLSTDLWRGPNLKEYFAVTAEGVIEEGKAFHFLLGLKELKGSKAGEEQAPFVMEVIKDFNIQGRLGYFVMDNDGTNDTMLRNLSIGT